MNVYVSLCARTRFENESSIGNIFYYQARVLFVAHSKMVSSNVI